MPRAAKRSLENEALASVEAGGDAHALNAALYRASFKDLPSRIDPALNQVLLGAAHDAIGRCRRLAIIPFNYLHNFPYHALPSIADRVQSGAIEAVVYAPSLRTLVEPKAAGAADRRHRSCLFIGYDIGSVLSIERELEIVRCSFAHVELLVDRKASKSRVLEALPRFDVVHFCCHGSFDLDALASYLQLADGRLFPVEVLALEAVPKIVFANACISASGVRTSRNGDQRIGLHTAFLLAGADGVIGTLWKGHDDIAVDLAAEFYAGCAKNPAAHPASVFTASQRRLYHKYKEPGMWAVHAYFGGLGRR
jgi:hypothetical protein